MISNYGIRWFVFLRFQLTITASKTKKLLGTNSLYEGRPKNLSDKDRGLNQIPSVRLNIPVKAFRLSITFGVLRLGSRRRVGDQV